MSESVQPTSVPPSYDVNLVYDENAANSSEGSTANSSKFY